ncbi:hypothetical protein BFF78_30000 [Streptomyces fodineus]|uniref:Chaplin domain-containing protein n=1 Tax=Streptomyces fodineus TaxID=1904616 RepID=A0A1D7YH95_9ACTN|nr:hypothetical protein [Streptomyces fodineus]AOR34719.1 hypothetical protein BFF78_30000 [Streptomyces fodineus]
MKKITALAALTAAGLTLAAPAHAEGHGSRGRINIAGRTLTGNKLCEQALGLVPLAAPWTGQSVYDACNDRAHVHHQQPQQITGLSDDPR